MSESDFILALKIRTQTADLRAAPQHIRGQADLSCSLCGRDRETLRHVLGHCSELQEMRIRNHNRICRWLGTLAAVRGWTAHYEPLFRTSDGARIPDLILIKGPRAIVVDVTVRFETEGHSGQDTLTEARAEKASKYSNLVPYIREWDQTIKEVLVQGFPVGARGKWPKENNKLLSLLGMPPVKIQQVAETLSRKTLINSVYLLKTFHHRTRGGRPQPS